MACTDTSGSLDGVHPPHHCLLTDSSFGEKVLVTLHVPVAGGTAIAEAYVAARNLDGWDSIDVTRQDQMVFVSGRVPFEGGRCELAFFGEWSVDEGGSLTCVYADAALIDESGRAVRYTDVASARRRFAQNLAHTRLPRR